MYRPFMPHEGPIEALTTFIDHNPPDEFDLPNSVSDAEAANAIQQHYDEAGFECTQEQAEAIVSESRASAI